MRCAYYVRVSRSDQDTLSQIRELRQYAESRNWEITKHYQDEGISGAKASRPGLDLMIRDAKRRKFDCILVWKLDRFGRSLYDCLGNIKTLESCGVRFICTTQGLDTDQSNPASRFMIQVLGAAAEFERELIRDRTRAGLLKARAMGRKPGRKPKIIDVGKVRQLLIKGQSLRQIAAAVNASKSAVQRVAVRFSSPHDLPARSGIYVVQDLYSGVIKLGAADILSKRITQHRAMIGVGMRVFVILPTRTIGEAMEREKQLHREINSHCPDSAAFAREWYKPTPELLAFVKRLRDESLIQQHPILDDWEPRTSYAAASLSDAVRQQFHVVATIMDQLREKTADQEVLKQYGEKWDG